MDCRYRSLIMSYPPNEEHDEDLWELVEEDHPNLTFSEKLRIYKNLKGD
mgnify:CR=1 FL=1